MAYIQAEISAEDVLDLMSEDAYFTREMWETLAERLNMGLAADNFTDMVSQMEPSRARWIMDQFTRTFAVTERLYLKQS